MEQRPEEQEPIGNRMRTKPTFVSYESALNGQTERLQGSKPLLTRERALADNKKRYQLLKQQELAEKKTRDANELLRRKQAINDSEKAKQIGGWEGAKQQMKHSASGDKLRLFPNDPNSFIDDYVNPFRMIGSMGDNLGHAFFDEKATVGDKVAAVATPLAVGALAGIGAKSNAQFINNLANPLAGTGQLVKKAVGNTYKLNPFAEKLNNATSSYRVVGNDAYQDALNTGVVRSVAPKVESNTGINLGGRPTSFPSFQKGFADTQYLPKEGGVIIKTDVPTFKRGELNPVTNEVIKGRHYAHRPIDTKTGQVINELPIDQVKMYKGQPHWLKGYQELSTSPISRNANMIPKVNMANTMRAQNSIPNKIRNWVKGLEEKYAYEIGETKEFLRNPRTARKEVEKGNQWLREWRDHPETQSRIADNNFTSMRDAIPYDKNVDSQYLNYRQSKKFAKEIGEDKVDFRGMYIGKESDINRGQSFVTRKEDAASTAIHEGTHKLTDGNRNLSRENKQILYDVVREKANRLFPYNPHLQDRLRYLADPTENHARIMQLRHRYGLKPGQVVTEEMSKKMIQDISAGRTNIDRVYGVIADQTKLAKAMNRIMTPAAVVGSAALVGKDK